MAEQEFTEAGKVGQKLRSGLASAYKAAKGGAKWGRNYIKDFVTEYGDEALLNLYPQAVNLTAAAGEAIAGVADKPINLGRYPYYNLQTQFDEPIVESTPPNAGVSQEEETPTITVSKPKRKPSEKLYRVMFAGKGAEASQTYETKEEADAALKKAGGKGAVAGINFSQQQKPGTKAKVFNQNYLMGRLGDKLPAEKTEARKKAYLDKDAQAYANKTMYDDSLKRAKSPEYKAAVQKRSRLANEAKRAKDYEDGAGFRSFKANVKARRESEGVLNDYNNQLGLLRSAYNQARQAGQPLTALKIQRSIQRYQEGVPKEMGERQKFAESGLLKERNDMLAKKLQEAEEAEEEERKKRKLAAANSDSGDYM